METTQVAAPKNGDANKYRGKCLHCLALVPPQAGHIIQCAGVWKAVCPGCYADSDDEYAAAAYDEACDMAGNPDERAA